MAYRTPEFNLEAAIWNHAFPPPANPPREIVDCQLRAPGKQSTCFVEYGGVQHTTWELLVPALTVVRDEFNTPGADIVECPSGSGRYYRVVLVDDVAKGFPNEYRLAYITKTMSWPDDIP